MGVDKIYRLLQECTVKLHFNGEKGTGFFVGQNLIITCAHGVEEAKKINKTVEAWWKGVKDPFQVTVDAEQYNRQLDIAILKVEKDLNHPCVYLDDTEPELNDLLYSFGYSKTYEESVTFNFEYNSKDKDNIELYKLKNGQAVPGMSGSPVLNLKTGKVCGMLRISRDTKSDLGGRAVPIKTILSNYGQIKKKHDAFHNQNHNWIELVNKQTEKDRTLTTLFALSTHYYQKLKSPDGRFSHLNISDLILPDMKNEFIETGVTVNEKEEDTFPLKQCLEALWDRSCQHTVLVGEGGMGKTVSLQWLWKYYLKRKNNSPLPLFITLNEFNNCPKDKREKFIINKIGSLYLHKENLMPEDENMLWDILRTPQAGSEGEKSIPALILLLDGFNEITSEKRELLLELKRIREEAAGVQIVITSRYDMRQTFNWNAFNLCRLKPLKETQIEDYLKSSIPAGTIVNLLTNPMMLTIYCAAAGISKEDYQRNDLDFKRKVESAGELLWNFIERQILEKWKDTVEEGKQAQYKFLFKHLLPFIGYQMEKAGQFTISEEEFEETIESYCQLCYEKDFFKTFPYYKKYITELDIKPTGDFEKVLQRTTLIKEKLCKELFMLVSEERDYSFIHQIFRDYFASVHLVNRIKIGLNNKKIPQELKDQTISIYLRRFLGEIEGEHYNKPLLINKHWSIDHYTDTDLTKLLHLCRDTFDGSSGYTVWNIIEIWKEVRGELTGCDLTSLNLTKVGLNGMICSRFDSEKTIGATFDKSLMHKTNIFPQGHSHFVTSVVYSGDGKKILSASWDNTLKEWDVRTGKCLRTYQGHSDSVTSAVYSKNGKKILSASHDKLLKEWNVKTGECLKTYKGHSHYVNSAVYSENGKKILSTSHDKTLKEWDVKTGECLKTYQSHFTFVNSAVYSNDGKKILSSSSDFTLKEWDAKTGECLRTYYDHSNSFRRAVYSNDGKKILSAGSALKEMDVETGKCVKIYHGHSAFVTSAVYSGDSKKILSASWDNTLKEWDTKTGACLSTYQGHSISVRSTIYSDDGRKILSASSDNSLKEWDAATGECLRTYQGHSYHVSNAVYSNDCKKILSAFHNTLMEWDFETGECLKTYHGHSNSVTSAVYSNDDKKILSISGNTIREWDACNGECLRTYQGYSDSFTSAVYSIDGKKILSASDDNTLKEWDVKTGVCLKTYQGHSNIVYSAVYSNYCKKILSASGYAIKEWDVKTGECLRTYQDRSGYVSSAVYSNDCKKILFTSSYTLKEWDVETGEYLKTYKGHSESVKSAVYSGDCKKILSASIDTTLKEWDVATGECLKTYHGHSGSVCNAVYSSDGNKILSASDDNTLKEWDVETGTCLRTWSNIPGLFIQGCSFNNLHPRSDFSDIDYFYLNMRSDTIQ